MGELRDDRQSGEGTNRINGDEQLLDIGKRFQDVEIHATLFECKRLLVKNVLDLFGPGVARLHSETKRTDGAGDEHFSRCGFARFAGDFHAAAVEPLNFIGKAERRELEAVRAKGIRFDEVRAGFDVGLVYAEDGFRLGGIEFVKAAMRTDGFVQYRAHRANGDVFFENGNLRDVLLLHGFQGVENSLIGARDDQLAHLSNGVFGVDDFRYGDGRRGIHVAALAHPFFVVNLAEVAHAGIRQQGDDEIVRSQVLCKTQGAGNASTAGAAREETFHFCEAARDDKTFFVIYLNDVVKDFQIHRCREKIFTDAFYDVRLGLDLFSRLEEIVVERTVGIDADDFDVGILFLQIFSHTTDRPAGTHAADKVRDFSFAVFPNFRAGRLVVRLRI